MSKFDLRDISDRLTKSRDTEAVVFEFLGYLQALRPDWRATLAFYEVSRDALVSCYERQGNRLVRRDIVVPVDHLPARLVRKFFHPSAFFNSAAGKRSLLSHVFGSSPSYEPDPLEAAALKPITALAQWQSCVCLPLADQEDMLAMLVIASDKRGAFGSRVVGELIPVKSMAALALAQHLHRTERNEPAPKSNGKVPAAAAEFQERLQRLNLHTQELEEDNRDKARKLEALAGEIELLDKNSTQYKQELERVKSTLFALEEQTAAATHHLTEAYSELTEARGRMTELQRTVRFMKEVFQFLGQEHEREHFPQTLVAWFSEHFHVERCSLMLLDPARETLTIAAQRGIDPAISARVRVRIGQGIAGWVAHNRKPLFVRLKDEQALANNADRGVYNSDSFVSVPLCYNNRLCGVLNLSNKRDGEPFDEFDLDRALLAGSIMAMSLANHEANQARGAASWA